MLESLSNLWSWSHWSQIGSLASLAGVLATVYFSRNAMTASQAARESAAKMRINLVRLDFLGELSRARQALNEIKQGLLSEEYKKIDENCGVVRSISNSILSSSGEFDHIEEIVGLEVIKSDVSELSEKCVKIFVDRIKPLSPKTRSDAAIKIDSHIESVERLHSEIRKTVEGENVS